RPVPAAYALLAALTLAYTVSTLVRPAGREIPLLDDVLVDAVHVAAGLLCLVRGARRDGSGDRVRVVALSLGTGLLLWAFGDIVYTLLSLWTPTVPVPSLADPFYLGLYPFAYLAVMLLIRSEARHFLSSGWLDGVVAGLGAAAVSAAFAFDTILGATGGHPLAVL